MVKHSILKGNNFVRLLGGSMETSIKLLNMFMEDAKVYYKPIWILLQDLSKAYDRVNLSILRKVMNYLRIPPEYTNFILNFFTLQRNAVLTKGDLSE